MTRHAAADPDHDSDPADRPRPRPRPLRADAARNRDKVLEAARAAFAAQGPAVPLDEIAKRAGVGAGTVYRHFPTKEALFEAVVRDRIDVLANEAETALAAEDAGAAFFAFFHSMVSDAAEKVDLADALMASGHCLQPETMETVGRLRTGLRRLLDQAQEAGAVRRELTTDDLHALVVGALAAERHAAAEGKADDGRLTAYIADGLRPRS